MNIIKYSTFKILAHFQPEGIKARPIQSDGTFLYLDTFLIVCQVFPAFFADDTAILMNADSVQNLQIKINNELDRISNLISINKLTVNPQKSHALIINSSLSEDQSHISHLFTLKFIKSVMVL